MLNVTVPFQHRTYSGQWVITVDDGSFLVCTDQGNLFLSGIPMAYSESKLATAIQSQARTYGVIHAVASPLYEA